MEDIRNIKIPRMSEGGGVAPHHPHHDCGVKVAETLPSDIKGLVTQAMSRLEEAKRLVGKTIVDVKQTQKSSISSGLNVIQFVANDGSVIDFEVRNGEQGLPGKDANIAGANDAANRALEAANVAVNLTDAVADINRSMNEAEAARAAAEAARVVAEQNRKYAFDDREERLDGIESSLNGMSWKFQQMIKADNDRTTAESARVAAENARVSAESARSSAESARVDAETSRNSAEAGRVTSEAGRVSSEAARVAAETARESASAAAVSAAEAATESANSAAESASQVSGQIDALARQVNTAIGGIDSKVESKVETEVAPIREEVKKLNDLFGNGVEGYVRVSGTSDPAFNYKHYSRGTNVESVFDCLKPCLVGNNFTGHVGEILHILEPLNWYKDIYGDARKIDGSEGEVLICNVRSIWEIAQHVKVGNVTYDVFLRSYTPFEWIGTPASEIKPMGIAPHFCVAHKDDDNVIRMHSAYNMEWNGSYNAQHTIVGKFVQTQNDDGSISEEYDADGAIFGGAGGLNTTDISLINGEQYAMNINDDNTKTYPYFNATARAEEVMYSAMVAEGGTFDAHNTNLMGSGWCCNDVATSSYHWGEAEQSARNGFRYQKSDGTWVMMNISKRGSIGFNPTKTGDYQYTCDYLNHWRSPWRIMEQQRVMMYAIENNIPELTWFAFEGNKYKWRNVNGFAGPSEGAMTCVLWKIYAGKFADGMTDPTNNLDVSGLRCEYIICSAIYRGRITDVSPSWWTSGMIFTEDSNGTYEAYMQRDQRKLIKSIYSNRNEADAQFSFEKDYDHVGTFAYGDGYRKDYNDSALMLPSNTSVQNGGGLHTYVGGYNYLNGSKPSAGVLSVRGFRRGFCASSSNMSPLYVYGGNSPSYANCYIAFGICCEIANRCS